MAAALGQVQTSYWLTGDTTTLVVRISCWQPTICNIASEGSEVKVEVK